MPRWQNLEDADEKFATAIRCIRGAAAGNIPWYCHAGRRLRQLVQESESSAAIRRRSASTSRSPSLPSATNFVDIDPEVKTKFGIPVARLHFKWGDNVLADVEAREGRLQGADNAAGGVSRGERRREPHTPGWSLHETGTCRMGNDPKHFVTNKFGQTHDVPNLYVCDASVFPSRTDKTTTLDHGLRPADVRIPGRVHAHRRDLKSTAPARGARRGSRLTDSRGP